MSIEEVIHQPHLEADIDEVEELTDHELGGVDVVGPHVVEDVSHNQMSATPVGFLIRLDRPGTEFL